MWIIILQQSPGSMEIISLSYSFPTGKAFSLVIHNSKKHRCPWLKRSVTGELYNHVTVCTVYTLYSSKPVEQQWGMQTKCINHRKPSWYKLYCVKIAWWWLAVSSLYLKWRYHETNDVLLLNLSLFLGTIMQSQNFYLRVQWRSCQQKLSITK